MVAAGVNHVSPIAAGSHRVCASKALWASLLGSMLGKTRRRKPHIHVPAFLLAG